MIAVPINTTLIVIIIGVTLFLEIVEIRKHKHDEYQNPRHQKCCQGLD